MGNNIIPGVIIDIKTEDEFIFIQGEDKVVKHFTNEKGEVNITASDLYVKDVIGRTIKLSSDYEEINFEIL